MNEHGEELSLLIGEIARRWRKRMDERLKPMGLTQAKWRALLHLSLADGISQRELSERLSIEGPTLVRLLDRLAKDGYIERRDAAHDRRCKQVHLTRKSQRVIRTILTTVSAVRHELFAHIPAQELRVGTRLLRQVRDRLLGD